MSTPTALIIKFHSRLSFGSDAPSQQLVFANVKAAKKAFGILFKAAKAYENRANDREKIVIVRHVSGECAVDVSDIATVGYFNELDEHVRPILEQWQKGIGEITGVGQGAHEAAKSAAASNAA